MSVLEAPELRAGELELSSITIDGAPLDLGVVLADVTIRHGRAGFFDAASASTCQITLLGVTRATTRPFRLGRLLVVNSLDGSSVAPRFTGRFTDADLDGSTLTAIAVGRLRTLSGYKVGTVDYPEEWWSTRVGRAFTDAGLGDSLVLEVGAFDPLLVARPADPVDLASYLDELATMNQAAVADLGDGTILVQAITSRTPSSGYALDPAEVAYSPAWAERLPDANVLTVTYGAGGSSSASSSDAASVALYGPIEASIATTLKSLADVQTMLTGRLARGAYAHWTTPATPLLRGRRLRIGQLLNLSLLPAAAPFDPWTPVLEGWTDRVVADRGELVWTMELSLSDPLLSGLAVPWNTVPAGELWNTVTPGLAWMDALTLDAF
jgi:hypothetical protein